MKNAIRRGLAVLFALMLVVGTLAALPATVQAADEEYVAKLGYATTDWSAQEWGDNVSTTVNGAGTYTLSWDLAEDMTVADAGVFVIDLEGAAAAGYKLTGLTITADGAEVPVDLEKIVTGDIEEKGNYRIEIYNQYGTTVENSPIDPALAFSTNLTITFTLEVGAPEGVYEAKLGYATMDWSAQEWGDVVKTVVTGAGTYTLSWDLAEDVTVADAGVFVIDVVGAGTAGFQLTDLAITADGNEIPVDLEKVVTGDVEENGNFRIEIYNQYGSTAENAPIDNALAFENNLTITFSIEGGAAPAEPVEKPAAPEFDPNSTYNAYLGVQTPNWTYRDPWNSANGIGSDYWGDFIYGNETNEKYGKVTDAVVAGNGTYTVSVTDFGTIFADDFGAAGQDYFNLLFISTDIPMSDDVQITDVKLIVDGKTVHTYKEAYLDPDSGDYVKILIQNIWNDDVAEVSYYNAPSTSLEMSFTIAGFAYDAAAEVPETEPAPVATEPAPAEQGGNTAAIVICVIAVCAVAAVVAIVLIKKKKAN